MNTVPCHNSRKRVDSTLVLHMINGAKSALGEGDLVGCWKRKERSEKQYVWLGTTRYVAGLRCQEGGISFINRSISESINRATNPSL